MIIDTADTSTSLRYALDQDPHISRQSTRPARCGPTTLYNSYLQSAFFASSLSNATQYAPGQPFSCAHTTASSDSVLAARADIARTVFSEVHIDHRELRGDLEDDDDGKAALVAISGENIV